MKPEFTTPCSIRKNTPDLRHKLENLGYVQHPNSLANVTSTSLLFCNRGFFAELPIGYKEEVDQTIDCGDDEELFLAIAALRNDSDKFQYFVCQDGLKKSLMDNWTYRLPHHKASVEELIEYFKDQKRESEIDKLAKEYAEAMCPVGDYCGGVYDDSRHDDMASYKNEALSLLHWLKESYCIIPKADVINQHSWYMQRMKEVSSNQHVNRAKAIALENLLGKEFFESEKI